MLAAKSFTFISLNLLYANVSQLLSLLLLISYLSLIYMRFIVMFVTAVCVLFLIKLRGCQSDSSLNWVRGKDRSRHTPIRNL